MIVTGLDRRYLLDLLSSKTSQTPPKTRTPNIFSSPIGLASCCAPYLVSRTCRSGISLGFRCGLSSTRCVVRPVEPRHPSSVKEALLETLPLHLTILKLIVSVAECAEFPSSENVVVDHAGFLPGSLATSAVQWLSGYFVL